MVLIASSSRGGSSSLAEVLRHSGKLRHLAGEINPLLRLAGLSYPDSGMGSDALGAQKEAAPLRALLPRYVGVPGNIPGAEFENMCTERLHWQWPEIKFRNEDVRHAICEAEPMFPDTLAFTHAMICALRADYQVHPGLYDLPMNLREAGAPLPSGRIVEEPPFIPFQPWLAVDDTRPFVVKAPSNAYRLDFFAAHWPGLKVLHLTRNPASSINGLLDGWRYQGFHSHRVGSLAIDGYSNVTAGGTDWWKFDLFPGWEAYRTATLHDVCAAQWSSAHRAILDWRARNPHADVLQIRFEDFLRNPREVIGQVCDWIRIEMDSALSAALGKSLPPVMATVQPRPRRWLERAASLNPLLQRPEIASLAAELGYDDIGLWI